MKQDFTGNQVAERLRKMADVFATVGNGSVFADTPEAKKCRMRLAIRNDFNVLVREYIMTDYFVELPKPKQK